jgi:phenylpropionate dioxygenase-like ring-hydroxylating dioxygenase large terminal subunit
VRATFIERWLPVARVVELADGPAARTWMGEPVALFRTADGGVACLEDVCPHRHARLSNGHVCGGEIVCAEHGWRFDWRGACVRSSNAAAKVVRQAVPAYRVSVVFGFVFITGRRQRCGD